MLRRFLGWSRFDRPKLDIDNAKTDFVGVAVMHAELDEIHAATVGQPFTAAAPQTLSPTICCGSSAYS